MPDHLTVTVIGERIPDLDLPAERRSDGGSGWVRRLSHLMQLASPTPVQVVDASEPSTTIHRLRERWCDDVLLPRPQVVVVQVGVADAVAMGDPNHPYAKDPEGLVAILRDLIERCRSRSPATRVIIVEPVINSIDESPLHTAPVAGRLSGYVAALRSLARSLALAILPAGDWVCAAKRARNDDEWLGTSPYELDSCGSLLLADPVARLILGLPAAPPSALGHRQSLLAIGDSITDASRREGAYRPQGNGYFRLLQGLQAAREPEKVVQMINKGIGGDTIIDIESRWSRDVLPFRPDWLLLYTGVNDMNTIYWGRSVHVLPEDYRRGLERCLTRSRAEHPATRCLVITPFFLTRDDHPASYRTEMLRRLPDYVAAATQAARTCDARFLDMQAVMRPLMDRFGHRALGSQLGADNVHPGELGSLACAEAVYRALC